LFYPGIDKCDQSGGDRWRERQHAGGVIDQVWVETQHSSGVGEIEVETKRQVHGGVECLGRDEEEVEVMDGQVHGECGPAYGGQRGQG